MNELITMVEAEVEEAKWEVLKQTYQKETAGLPSVVKQTFLMQSQSQPNIWRIVTHWISQAALDHMRATVDVPVAARVFRAVGATPYLEIWNSVVHQHGSELQ